MKQFLIEVLVAGTVAGWLVLAGWLGGVLARRVAAEIKARGLRDHVAKGGDAEDGVGEKEHPQLGMVHGASLGLMALLLGFSFSAAMDRYTRRYDIISREASALSTVWDRADLLPEGARAGVKSAAREYLAVRIALFEDEGRGEGERAQARVAQQAAVLWKAVRAGVVEHPPAMNLMVAAVGEVSDLLDERNSAASRHIPAGILAVLMACAFVSQAMVGYSAAGAGAATRRRLRLPVWSFAALMTASLWATIDLDFPRLGVIRLTDGPLVELKAAMDREMGTGPG